MAWIKALLLRPVGYGQARIPGALSCGQVLPFGFRHGGVEGKQLGES
jgi:hypothetical protein